MCSLVNARKFLDFFVLLFGLWIIVIFFGLGRTLQMDYLMQQKDSVTACVHRELVVSLGLILLDLGLGSFVRWPGNQRYQ